MEGERDFTGIRLTDRDVAGEHFTFLELSDYLTKQDLNAQPIILNEANFQHGEFARSSFFNTERVSGIAT